MSAGSEDGVSEHVGEAGDACRVGVPEGVQPVPVLLGDVGLLLAQQVGGPAGRPVLQEVAVEGGVLVEPGGVECKRGRGGGELKRL